MKARQHLDAPCQRLFQRLPVISYKASQSRHSDPDYGEIGQVVETQGIIRVLWAKDFLTDYQRSLIDDELLNRIRFLDDELFRFPGMFGGITTLFNHLK